MTVKEVLKADWTVESIVITVRDANTTRFLEEYHIGENLQYSNNFKYVQETKAGTLYSDVGMKHLYMERIIQYRHLSKKSKGEELCVGVVMENIPQELLDLEIGHMRPYGCGRSDDMHGYLFNCYSMMWFGVPGENEKIEESRGGADEQTNS